MTFNDIIFNNISRDKATYISYFISSVFSIIIFFFFMMTAFHPMLATVDINGSLGLAMITGGMIVFIFSFTFIISSMLAFLKKRMKNLGIFMINGASLKQVRTIVFRENMIIGLFSILTALVIGLIISPLFLMLVKRVFQSDDFAFYFPVQALLITTVLFVILFIIVSKLTTYFINKDKALDLLKSDIKADHRIQPSYVKLGISMLLSLSTISLVFLANFNPAVAEFFGPFDKLIILTLIVSSLAALYYLIKHGIYFLTNNLDRQGKKYRGINLLLISNLKEKENTYATIFYLLTILILAVFLGTSVLYSSFHYMEETAESAYPWSFQYVSMPDNPEEQVEKDVEYINGVLNQENEDYFSSASAFKTDWTSRVGFMTESQYKALSPDSQLHLNANEYYVVAGAEGQEPSTTAINNYISEELTYKGTRQDVLLSTGLQAVYYVLPDASYDSLDYPLIDVLVYEVDDWPHKQELFHQLTAQVDTIPMQRLITSKIDLYEVEQDTARIMLFMGIMLSAIFLSASMSILYFYLQSSFAKEKIKYDGIRKIGLSKKEIKNIFSRELSFIIFGPFALASLFLLLILITLANTITGTFGCIIFIGVGLFLILFIISFLIIRNVYVDKIVA